MEMTKYSNICFCFDYYPPLAQDGVSEDLNSSHILTLRSLTSEHKSAQNIFFSFPKKIYVFVIMAKFIICVHDFSVTP